MALSASPDPASLASAQWPWVLGRPSRLRLAYWLSAIPRLEVGRLEFVASEVEVAPSTGKISLVYQERSVHT